jgi:P pilus assembly chaperone PapD
MTAGRAGLWFALTALTGLSGGRAAFAQSVSPPIAEYPQRAKSSFQLRNSSLFPVTVVLEVRGFTVTEAGEVIDVPFDTSRVHVKLSEMSFRIPPRGVRTVFYEASSDSLPTWFNILSAMSGAKTENGLSVRILLPHVVYLNQKESLQRQDVAIQAFQFDRAARKARVQLENLGPNLGRVYQVTISDGHGTNQEGGGFPLLPRKRRWVEVDWNSDTPPSRVILRVARFTLDTVLTPTATSLTGNPGSQPSRP